MPYALKDSYSSGVRTTAARPAAAQTAPTPAEMSDEQIAANIAVGESILASGSQYSAATQEHVRQVIGNLQAEAARRSGPLGLGNNTLLIGAGIAGACVLAYFLFRRR